MTKKRTAAPVASMLSVLALLLIAAVVYAVPRIGEAADGTLKSAQASDRPVEASFAGDYYRVTGKAQRPYQPSRPGTVEYCPTDRLNRALCAYGELTDTQRRAAQQQGRQEIEVDPVGWPKINREIEIPAVPGLPRSRAYHGWFYNRSHLLADSLGGSPGRENLVTGTRTQNVGSVNNSGGMAYAETLARAYLDRNGKRADACPLYYAATAVYVGDELVPRTVLVDVRSCDGAIDLRVEVANAAQGWAIDYATGDYRRTD